MAVSKIPEVINDFNLYLTGSKLIGTTGEVKLPDFEAITATISGNGILGEYESPVIGQFSDMEIEIPFRCLNEDYFKLIDTTKSVELDLRGALQNVDQAKHASNVSGMRVSCRGRCKKFAPGTVKQREAMDSSITLDLTYIAVIMNDKERVRLDKLNGEYRVNGVDKLAAIRNLI